MILGENVVDLRGRLLQALGVEMEIRIDTRIGLPSEIVIERDRFEIVLNAVALEFGLERFSELLGKVLGEVLSFGPFVVARRRLDDVTEFMGEKILAVHPAQQNLSIEL